MDKWIMKSLTIWGGIVMFLVNIVPVFGPMIGLDVSADDIQNAGNAVSEAIRSVGTAVGLVMVIIGRYRAGGVKALP